MHLAEAASHLGVSAITLKRWLLSGRIEDVSRDRKGWRLFKESDLKRIRAAFLDPPSLREDAFPHGAAPAGVSPKVASFFSGIGGLELGFERSGFEVSFQCEINEFCRAILNHHWPATPRWDNIKTLENERIPVSDAWIGGFPCQDVSLARMGARKGLRGAQSGLFHEFARLLGAGRPRVVVIENVAGLLSSHRGRDFATILRTLEELGYTVGWRTLNSRYFGVPQSRDRVYIVGCHRDRRGPGRILFEPECRQRDVEKGGPHGEAALSPFKAVVEHPGPKRPVTQALAYCLYATSARHTGTDWSRTYVCYPEAGAVRRLTPAECEGIMGFPKHWTKPRKSEVFDKDVDSLRYHALGNAVTPPVAEWLGQRVMGYLQAVRRGL